MWTANDALHAAEVTAEQLKAEEENRSKNGLFTWVDPRETMRKFLVSKGIGQNGESVSEVLHSPDERDEIQETASSLFPDTSPAIALAQYNKLLLAKFYMRSRGILAVEVGSKFTYRCATGSVLGAHSGGRGESVL